MKFLCVRENVKILNIPIKQAAVNLYVSPESPYTFGF